MTDPKMFSRYSFYVFMEPLNRMSDFFCEAVEAPPGYPDIVENGIRFDKDRLPIPLQEFVSRHTVSTK